MYFLIFVSFPLVLDLVPHPWVGLVPSFLEACQILLETTGAEPKRGNDRPSAIPHHSAMSLPLGCLIHANLITCLTGQPWAVCVPCSRSPGVTLCLTAWRSREQCLLCWGGERWTLRDLPPYIQTAAASWLSTAAPAPGFFLDDGCLAAVMKVPHFSLRTSKFLYGSAAFEIILIYST